MTTWHWYSWLIIGWAAGVWTTNLIIWVRNR